MAKLLSEEERLRLIEFWRGARKSRNVKQALTDADGYDYKPIRIRRNGKHL
jgi:hypothetical protein